MEAWRVFVVVVASAFVVVSLGPLQGQSGGVAAAASCVVSQGSWVRSTAKPLYDGRCPFVRSTQNCMKNGRKDTTYLSWAWKPATCSIPAFNPATFLATFRNKRIAIAGDSFSGNFESAILCILHSASALNKIVIKVGTASMDGYLAPSFNVTIIHINSQFMVNAVPLTASQGSAAPWRVNLDIPDKAWLQVLPSLSLLVFNTGHWYSGAITSPLRKWQIGGKPVSLAGIKAMQIGIETVGKAIQSSTAFKGQAVFFTYSPFHYMPAYPPSPPKTCKGALLPFSAQQAAYALLHDDTLASRNAQVAALAKYPRVKVLDISRLSTYRPDAHVQNYVGDGSTDCSHWCLPGLPDQWANILYKIVLGL